MNWEGSGPRKIVVLSLAWLEGLRKITKHLRMAEILTEQLQNTDL
jgi:hypothetical protein